MVVLNRHEPINQDSSSCFISHMSVAGDDSITEAEAQALCFGLVFIKS